MKKLSKIALQTQAKKYNRLKDKRGVYGQLVSKLGKTQANKILRASKQLDKKTSSITKSQTIKKKKHVLKICMSDFKKTIKRNPTRIILETPPQSVMAISETKNIKHKDVVEAKVWCPVLKKWRTEFLTPEYAPAAYFDKFPVVVEILGKRWEIDVEPPGVPIDEMTVDEIAAAKWSGGKEGNGSPVREVTFTATKKPLSIPTTENKPYIVKMFGQQESIQRSGEIFPVKNGKLIPHLMTIESDWGDSGNEVYWLELDKNKNPNILYHEDSTH